jgi:hypothetical protein
MMKLLSRKDDLVVPTNGLIVTNGRHPVAMAQTSGARYQQRAFTAAATPINVANRTEANRLKKLRQPWQEEAWEYRDAIGELRYATTYLGNCSRRMVIVPSAYVKGEVDPIPLEQIDECPKSVIAAADDALERLAVGGSVALGGVLRDITENFEVTGECFLIGRVEDGQEIWEIRSITEIGVDADGQVSIRTPNSSGQGEPLPKGSFISRLWWPHPRRKELADAPFKAILDLCEELLILSRDVRAAGRSRLANNGILAIPDTLSIVRANIEDDAQVAGSGDEFLQELVTAAMAAIQDEGSAAAVLPLIARGPRDDLRAIRQIVISRQDPGNADKRMELITRMATGIDLPAEVLTGKAGLNHWTSWQVSDDTFRHHIEPIVMVETDALTLGYYRPELSARQVPDEWLNRIVLWYDPTNLVTHPDRSDDAFKAHDKLAISDESLRGYLGFSEEDKPEPEEVLRRLATKTGLDPTIAAQVVSRLDGSIDISGVASGPPQIQMIGPGPGEQRPADQPAEQPPEEQGSPTALPASGDPATLAVLGQAMLTLLQGGQQELGGPGSGRYPKGSGGSKDPSKSGGKSPEESIGEIGVGSRNDLDEGVASQEELDHARQRAREKYEASPTPTDEDRKRAAEKHARSKRAGGDDRPGSKQRKANRQALLNDFGDGTKAPCVCCGRNVTASTMSLDRIVPGSDGGTYKQGNLVPMDYDCNRERSDTPFSETIAEWDAA